MGYLQMVHRALLPAMNCVTAGHVTMLKHKCLTALMRRLDNVLLDRLIGGMRIPHSHRVLPSNRALPYKPHLTSLEP